MNILKIAAKKHFREGIFIFISVLGAFALESYRESILQVKLKDKLLKQLTVMIAEDISQLNEVHKKLDLTLNSAEILTDDFLSKEDKLNQELLAKKFSDLRFMNLSFFPQYGIYNQLLSSNGLENIKDEKLKKELVYLYENLLKRIQAADPVLDEMRWKTYLNLSSQIVVLSSDVEQNQVEVSDFPQFEHEVDYFYISEDYYDSMDVLNFYNQITLYIKQYKTGLNNVESALESLLVSIENELN